MFQNRPQTRSERAPEVARSVGIPNLSHLVGTAQEPSVGESGGEGRPGRVLGGECVALTLPDSTESIASRPGNDAGLGSLTGYCPAAQNSGTLAEQPAGSSSSWGTSAGLPPERGTPQGPALDGLLSSFELRSKLRRHATSPRIAICGARVFGDPSIVTEETEDGDRHVRWTGIVLCNRAGCPVCGAAKARKFHRQVLRTLQAGGHWQHVVFTVSHHHESWERVYWRVMDGLRAMSKGIVGRLVRQQVRATIRATESTWARRHGWHVHLHVLWKLSRPLLEEEKRLVRQKWHESTGASFEHGAAFGACFHCLQDADRRQAAKYLAKLALELAGAAKSAKPGHFNLGELYHEAANGAMLPGGMVAVGLVREYQRQTKGKRLYQLDRRAKLLHDAAPPIPEQKVVRTWITPIDRIEFSALSRGERRCGEALACYLPLEVAARARGDPTDAVLDVLYDLLQGFTRSPVGRVTAGVQSPDGTS